ncbi:MAG: hypothetical protein KGD64_14495 [Candidatus Heimdallarchaeota archaeon]|nr:hypothetical protein [Candidatus Heimdallarchaeota archaeon]
MPKKSSKKKKEKEVEELVEKIDYSYITEEEIINGFKPSNTVQSEARLCPFCSSTNTSSDDVCFNCRKKLD